MMFTLQLDWGKQIRSQGITKAVEKKEGKMEEISLNTVNFVYTSYFDRILTALNSFPIPNVWYFSSFISGESGD